MMDNSTNQTTVDPVTWLADTSTVLDYNMTNQTTAKDVLAVNEAVKYIGYISVPLLCIVGLIGNALTVIIMSSKHFRSSTTFVFLSALAISDSVYLVLTPFTKQFINKLLVTDIRALTLSGCKAFFCFFRASKVCSAMFVTVMCLERFLVIWFPFHAKLISTKTTATFTVSAVTVAVFILFGFWTIVDDIVGGVCIPNTSTPETKHITAGLLIAGTTLYNMVPPIVLLVCTPLTVFKLYRQQSIRRTLAATRTNNDVERITKTLVCVMIAYIILVTPSSVAHSVAFFSGDNIFESKDPDFIVFREIALMMESMNYSINFFLYVVSNKTFRKRLIKMFDCTVKRREAAVSLDGSYLRSGQEQVTVSTISN